jgi:hypothetical protein
MSKQTAVEWLYNNLKSHFEHDGDLLEVVQFSFEQAKAMEKEQIGYSEEDMKEAFIAGGNSNITEDDGYGSRYLKYMDKWFEQFKNK